MSLSQKFYESSLALQAGVYETNKPTLQAAGLRIAESLAADGVLHTFGSGHSQILAAEIERRAGGLVPVSSINDPADGWPEQIVGYGARLFQRCNGRQGFFVAAIPCQRIPIKQGSVN